MKARIIKRVYVEAARRLAPLQAGEERYTGNSYCIDLIAEAEIDPDIGWVIDYGDIKRLFEPVHNQIDHSCLSDIPGLEDDASPEALERWIGEQLRPWPEWFAGLRVSLPAPDAFQLIHLAADAVLEMPERLAFLFSAAQALPQLPEGHPCRRLHGHTYQVEFASCDHDAAARAAEALYHVLNDSYLNKIPGLEQATAERIAAWIWRSLSEYGVAPSVVAVQETPSNRCHYYGE